MESLFYQGLVENDRGKLLVEPKSDIHNHSSKGCRLSWLSEQLNRDISRPPASFSGLGEMQEWFDHSVKPYCKGKQGILLRWKGAFAEAKRNNIFRLALSFGTPDIELVGGIEAFIYIIRKFQEIYCPNAIVEPELTYSSFCNVEQEADNIDKYVESGFFKSIDICCGENVQPIEAFIPLYRKAEQYHLIKKMHVGETGSAAEVRKAVEVLGLTEVHHGINASTSNEVIKFLADNRIQLNVCPSSNVMLGYVDDFKVHPIKKLVENGVKVTINTDDLLIFDSSIENEYIRLYQAGVLSAKQLDDIRLNGLSTTEIVYSKIVRL